MKQLLRFWRKVILNKHQKRASYLVFLGACGEPERAPARAPEKATVLKPRIDSVTPNLTLNQNVVILGSDFGTDPKKGVVNLMQEII